MAACSRKSLFEHPMDMVTRPGCGSSHLYSLWRLASTLAVCPALTCTQIRLSWLVISSNTSKTCNYCSTSPTLFLSMPMLLVLPLPRCRTGCNYLPQTVRLHQGFKTCFQQLV